MKRLRRKRVGRAVCTILQQLAMTVPVNVVYSWGITNKVATQIEVMTDNVMQRMAALKMNVHGFNYQGKLYVALDEKQNNCRLYSVRDGKLKEERSSVEFNELGRALDAIIETGGLSQQEHLQRLKEYVKQFAV